MAESVPHIVILGGGFGGLAASNEIRKFLSESEARVTIIDKKDWFMMDLVKLWIIKGIRNFETSKRLLTSLGKKGINFLNEEIVKIEPHTKTVYTSEQKLSYDFLIIALGVELAPKMVPGLEDNGMILYDLEEVPKIHQRITAFQKGKIAFSIMGLPYKCPPAPYEAALIINDMLKKSDKRNQTELDFYTPAPITMPAAGPEVSNQLLEILESENINFHGSSKPVSVRPGKIVFEDSEAEFDVLIAVPPHKVPDVVVDSGIAEKGKYIQVERDCKTQFDNVYAIGDVTLMQVTKDAVVPKAGIFAEGQGIAVGRNICSIIKKEKEQSTFDGKGGCFVEMGENAGYVEVDLFSEQQPITRLRPAGREYMQEKERFEKERLEKWL